MGFGACCPPILPAHTIAYYIMENTLTIPYHNCAYDDLSPADRTLADKAREATYLSYAPYSRFKVGAAVLLSNGEMVQGSNQENAAFGAGTCAERCALHYAESQNPNATVVAIAIAARGTDDAFTHQPIAPCGICRQVLIETQKRAGHDIRVLLCGHDTVLCLESVRHLLPFTFDSF